MNFHLKPILFRCDYYYSQNLNFRKKMPLLILHRFGERNYFQNIFSNVIKTELKVRFEVSFVLRLYKKSHSFHMAPISFLCDPGLYGNLVFYPFFTADF